MPIGFALLVILALVTQSGVLFFFLAVMLAGVLLSRWWIGHVGIALRVHRQLETRLFFQETTTITLSIINSSSLPAPWVVLRESVPADLMLPAHIVRVVSLAGGQSLSLTYDLTGKRRGFHTVGPLELTVGDVLGLAQRTFTIAAYHHIVVYPRLLTAHALDLPSVALFGDVRHQRPLLGDPSRLAGVRPYRAGDPLHDIHWPATATIGELQVKSYLPSTSIHVMVFLDMQRTSYSPMDILYTTDLAVSVAATIAQTVVAQRQEVGLATNGSLVLPPPDRAGYAQVPEGHDNATVVVADGLATRLLASGDLEVAVAPLLPASGRVHLMRLLDVLARVEIADRTEALREVLLRHSLALPWGSTIALITGCIDEPLILALARLRQAGLLVVLYVIARLDDEWARLQTRVQATGVRVRFVWQDGDLA